jgi:hypothetical protein
VICRALICGYFTESGIIIVHGEDAPPQTAEFSRYYGLKRPLRIKRSLGILIDFKYKVIEDFSSLAVTGNLYEALICCVLHLLVGVILVRSIRELLLR